ncbi:peroxiredoxin-like family protein [Rubellicoccus peritrichatus]|uniref:thioredoxin-dependent peroxiredoxin n=1 Tax=Rubellicoccus peritrichatus TaxID=3080537 RepID=A0AAQ3QUX0_9BACT|nr:peroxiredoxin-like family protein [Puniceicoccus sp. CR14]WOO40247.1 peroxiredoxin-like family protein [Puniceicoccus sp. CR14]
MFRTIGLNNRNSKFKKRKTMKLKNELNAFRAEFSNKVDEETVSIIDRASAELEVDFQSRNPSGVGDKAPDFTLPSANGASVSLSEKLQEGPVIITFYRGDWCPYCNLELRAYQRILPEIKEAGGSLIAISPQTPDSSLTTAEKNNLEFDVLSDVGSKVAQGFGISFKLPEYLQELYNKLGGSLPEYNGTNDWTLPVPATFVVDRESRIVLAHVDTEYQNRLEPNEALVAINAINSVKSV